MTRKANVTSLYDGNTSHSEGTSWADSAQCIGMDTNLFFEDEREDFPSLHAWTQSNRAKMTEARRICSGCPVIEHCLNANLDAVNGVFGGKSYKQRETLAKSTGQWIKNIPKKTVKKMDPDSVRLILQYREEGLTYRDINSLTGIDPGTISRVLNNPVYNSKARPAAESTYENLRFTKCWNEPKYKAVRELVKEGVLSAKAIGEVTGFSAKTVRRVKYSMDKETKV